MKYNLLFYNIFRSLLLHLQNFLLKKPAVLYFYYWGDSYYVNFFSLLKKAL